MPRSSPPPSRKRGAVENTVIIVVTLVWAITFLLDPFVPSFTPRPEVAFIMTAIVGALWGAKAFKRNGGSDGT